MCFEEIQQTGVVQNHDTQMHEAWIVDQHTSEKQLVSSCSMCVPADQYQWWVTQVWSDYMPEFGVTRLS